MQKQRGFSLVEVMVGVVIALISMVAMFTVQENWDKQRRSIASGGDAQVAGSISAFNLERDLRNAGSGFGNILAAYLGCTVSAHDNATGADFTFTYVPVLITDGAGGLPDTVSILYGNSSSPTPTFEVAATTQTMTTMKDTRTGLALGDLVVVTTPSPTTCRLAEVTSLQPVSPDSGREVGHDTASYTRTTTPPANRLAGGAGACTGAGPYTCANRFPSPTFTTYTAAPPTYGELRSLGDDPRLNVWSVNNVRAVLVRGDQLHDGTTTTDVGEGVINLQAQYGLDTNADDVVDTWQASTPDWTQVRVIRFALLSRGESYDRLAVTTTVPSWSGGSFVMRNVDGTADSGAGSLGVNNWRNYRYSVFEVTVPLRNMIWRRFW